MPPDGVMQSFPNAYVLSHPVIQQKLVRVRDRQNGPEDFRRGLSEIAALLVYEALRDCPVEPVDVETPLGPAVGAEPASPITIVPILRSGLAMVDGVLSLIPQARVGHLGVYRDETSMEPVVYYNRLPPDTAATDVLVLDAMVATGGSATAAVSALKHVGASRIRMVCVAAAPEGLRRLGDAHPDVRVYTAAVDLKVDRNGYILPGLGDAGERLFGTR